MFGSCEGRWRLSEFLTPADLLAEGLRLPMPKWEPEPVPAGTHCAITGQPITEGYRVQDMSTGATAEFLDCFRGGLNGWVSVNAARCFKSSNPRIGNPCARSVLAFAGGTLYNPLINRDAAIEQGRPYWSSLVREVWRERAGQQCLCIVTTDTKKRLWINARVGALGETTPVFAYDSKSAMDRTRVVSWPALIECLNVVEVAYSAGFAKLSIQEGLLSAYNTAREVGWRESMSLEAMLSRWRPRPEFAVAVLMAQKAPEQKEEENPCPSKPQSIVQMSLL